MEREMRIDVQGWKRRVREYTVINKNLLSYGYHTPKVKEGYYHRGYPKAVAYNQIDAERFELTFQSHFGPSEFSLYRYSVEFNINELLPFIKPLLANKTLSELGLSNASLLENFHDLKTGELYNQYEIWRAFNEGYSYPDDIDPDKTKYFPKYSKSKDGKCLLVFLNLTEGDPSHQEWIKSQAMEEYVNDSYNEQTRLIHWFGNKNTNSSQPLFQDVINNNLVVHFFSNWGDKDVKGFSHAKYLGNGKFMHSNDNFDNSNTIFMVHQIY